jgi:flagellin-specific chaperone FliS
MFIASQKRKENIAEYLIYMWQVEDLIRANNLDIAKIDSNIISKYGLSDEMHKQVYDWYESLIDMMRSEGVQQSGHLQLNKNTIILLSQLHNQLLSDTRFSTYSAQFYKTLPFIVELRAKSGEQKVGEIETCFNALYGLLMMRLQHKELSKDTERALQEISKFIAMLAFYFKKDEEDDLFKDDNQ